MARCAAQLRLLDHGLIDAAEGVDAIIASAPGTKLTLDMVDDDGEDGDDEANTGDPSSIARALDKYVAHQLKRASGSKRDDYHDSVVYNTRKAVIKAFLYLKSSHCKYCSAYVVSLSFNDQFADEWGYVGNHIRSAEKASPRSSNTTLRRKGRT